MAYAMHSIPDNEGSFPTDEQIPTACVELHRASLRAQFRHLPSVYLVFWLVTRQGLEPRTS